MNKPDEETASHTVDVLAGRLRRLEHIVLGQPNVGVATRDAPSAIKRLAAVQRAVNQIAAKSRTAHDLLQLHSRHPDLFFALDSQEALSSLETAGKLSIILSAASSYPLVASSLTSIVDTPLPNAKLSANLAETRDQVAELETLQDSQMQEISILRQRSAAVLQRWYSVGILSTGDCWAEMEERICRVDQASRRATSLRQTENSIA